MTPTLQHFTRALLTPDLSLQNARRRPCGDRARRTAAADAHDALRRGRDRMARRRWLAAMPLSPAALASARTHGFAARRLNTDHLAQFRILRDEMRWTDAWQRAAHAVSTWRSSTFPRATVRRSAAHGTSGAAARGARHAARTALRELNFSHNNLRTGTSAGTRGGSCRCVTTTPAYRPVGRRRGRSKAFAAETPVRRRRPDALRRRRREAVYNPLRRLTGHRWTSHVFEGLVCVEDDERIRIRRHGEQPRNSVRSSPGPGDFREGRAEVRDRIGHGTDRPPGTLRHPARIRNRRLRRRRTASSGAERRTLGAVRLSGTTPDGIWNGNNEPSGDVQSIA